MDGNDKTVVVRIGGEGGEGTITLGDLFTRIAAYSGLEVYSFRTYPAEIRGGQVMYQTRLGVDRVMTEGDEANVLVAMNYQAWVEEHNDLCKDAALVYEASIDVPGTDHRGYPIPAERIAEELDWPRSKNFVLLGALTWFFRLEIDGAENLVVRTTLRPPGEFEAAIRALYEAGAGGQSDVFAVAAVLSRYRADVRLAGGPWVVQRPLLRALAGIATMLGRNPLR